MSLLTATLVKRPTAMLMLKRHVQSLIEKGALTKAISAAAEYVRRNPDCAAGHHLVAFAEEAAGYTRAAIQSISHAVNLSPENPSLRIMRARLLLRDHRLKDAIADVDAIIALGRTGRDSQLLREAISCRDELLERVCLRQSNLGRGPVPTPSPCGPYSMANTSPPNSDNC